jgi:hypothetical protein
MAAGRKGDAMLRIAFVTALVLLTLGLSATAAQADAPLHEGPFSFPVRIDDFFAPSGQSCDFPVVGAWDVTMDVTTFFYAGTDQPARVVANLQFEGTLSNPLNGKSVPDADHHDKITDYFAPDGTFLKEVENESRDDSLLHAAFHFVIDGDGNIVADAGRDWFTTARVVVDIAPLCEALS